MKVDQLASFGTLILDKIRRKRDDEECESEPRKPVSRKLLDVMERCGWRRGASVLSGPTQSSSPTVNSDPPQLATFDAALNAWAAIVEALAEGDLKDLDGLVDFLARFGALKPDAQQRAIQLLLSGLRGGQGAQNDSTDGPSGARVGSSDLRSLTAAQLEQLLRSVMGKGPYDQTVLARMARTFLQGNDPLTSLTLRFVQLPPAAQRAILLGDDGMLRGALQLLLGPSYVRSLGTDILEILRAQLADVSRGLLRRQSAASPREALQALLAELAGYNSSLGTRVALEAFIAPLYGFPPLLLLKKILTRMSQEERGKFWKRVQAKLRGRAGSQRAVATVEAAQREAETFVLMASAAVPHDAELQNLYVVGYMLGHGDPIPVRGEQESAYPSGSYLHENEAGAFEKLALHVRDDLDASDRVYVLYKIERTPGMSDLGRALTAVVYSSVPPAEALGGEHEMAQLNHLAGQLLGAAPSLKNYL